MKDNENFDEIVEMKLYDEDLKELFDLDIQDSIISISAAKNCDGSNTNSGGWTACNCCY